MKSKLLSAISFVLFMCACNTPAKHYVQFKEPQPLNVQVENKISKKWRGTYDAIKSNKQLVIDEQRFVLNSFLHLQGNRSEFELPDSLHNAADSILLHVLKKEYDFVYLEKDTFYMTNVGRDTLFEISDHQILKKMKRRYFLNSSYEQNWLVKCIEKHGDSLFFGTIFPGDTLLELDFAQKVEKVENRDTLFYMYWNLPKSNLKTW